MSDVTIKRIDDLLHRVTNRAARIKEPQIYADADMAIALLTNLVFELDIEERNETDAT